MFNRTLSASEVLANFGKSPDFSTPILAKIPKGTTEVIATISWQGTGGLNATITSPGQVYTEDTVPVYQKTTYSTSDSMSSMLNIKRISVQVSALSSDQDWYITFKQENVEKYQISIEIQK